MRTLTVRTADQLARAFTDAQPGDEVTIAPGRYRGNFTVTAKGTQEQPITYRFHREAVLKGEDPAEPALLLTGEHVHLLGTTTHHDPAPDVPAVDPREAGIGCRIDDLHILNIGTAIDRNAAGESS